MSHNAGVLVRGTGVEWCNLYHTLSCKFSADGASLPTRYSQLDIQFVTNCPATCDRGSPESHLIHGTMRRARFAARMSRNDDSQPAIGSWLLSGVFRRCVGTVVVRLGME